MLRSTVLFLALLGAGTLANAQTAGTITLTANKTSATGSLTPVLTWSTTPTASSCQASGGWSGTKFASGTQTLPAITSSKSYTLTCSWGGGTTTVRWTAPTKNTDGSTLTDLAGYRIYYGRSATELVSTIQVPNAGMRSYVVENLAAGTYYFVVRAYTNGGAESPDSNTATKVVQ